MEVQNVVPSVQTFQSFSPINQSVRGHFYCQQPTSIGRMVSLVGRKKIKQQESSKKRQETEQTISEVIWPKNESMGTTIALANHDGAINDGTGSCPKMHHDNNDDLSCFDCESKKPKLHGDPIATDDCNTPKFNTSLNNYNSYCHNQRVTKEKEVRFSSSRV